MVDTDNGFSTEVILLMITVAKITLSVLQVVMAVLCILLGFYQFCNYVTKINQQFERYDFQFIYGLYFVFKQFVHYGMHFFYALCLLVSALILCLTTKPEHHIINEINRNSALSITGLILVFLVFVIIIQILWNKVFDYYGSKIHHIDPNKNDNVLMMRKWYLRDKKFNNKNKKED